MKHSNAEDKIGAVVSKGNSRSEAWTVGKDTFKPVSRLASVARIQIYSHVAMSLSRDNIGEPPGSAGTSTTLLFGGSFERRYVRSRVQIDSSGVPAVTFRSVAPHHTTVRFPCSLGFSLTGQAAVGTVPF